jgi:proline iminopeptidase
MRASIRGTEIYFDIDGPGLVLEGGRPVERPTAFLVHGGPGVDHTSLKARYASLKDKMQLVYFDHRGHGRSGRGDPRTYTLDENVEDMEALRRHLGLGAIVSIGTSYGGIVAMAHAARYPDSVSLLVLVATMAQCGYVAAAKKNVALRGSAQQVRACDDLFAGRVDSAQKMKHYFLTMGSLYAKVNDPALSERGLDNAILAPEALNVAHGPGGFLRTLDLRPELPNITAATLVLAGRHDWICPPEFSEEIRDLIPGAELRVFESSAHAIGGDEPQKFLDAVSGFIAYKARA